MARLRLRLFLCNSRAIIRSMADRREASVKPLSFSSVLVVITGSVTGMSVLFFRCGWITFGLCLSSICTAQKAAAYFILYIFINCRITAECLWKTCWRYSAAIVFIYLMSKTKTSWVTYPGILFFWEKRWYFLILMAGTLRWLAFRWSLALL